MTEEIEFNNGFVTALGLFYGHRQPFHPPTGQDFRLNGATDHLAEMEYPKTIDKELKTKIEKFREDAFARRYDFDIPANEVVELFDRCYKLLMEIDKIYFGLKVEVHHP